MVAHVAPQPSSVATRTRRPLVLHALRKRPHMVLTNHICGVFMDGSCAHNVRSKRWMTPDDPCRWLQQCYGCLELFITHVITP